jgi:hypothetical protein
MQPLMASRLVRATVVLAVAIVVALFVMRSGFTESRQRVLTWPDESGADTLHVSIFAIWRGSAGNSPPQRIKVTGSAPGEESMWTYVDPATLQCFDTSGDGAQKGAPLGSLSAALLRERLPVLPETIEAAALDTGIAVVEACVRRVATEGASGMVARPVAGGREGDLYEPTLEFPHWWTFPGSGGEAAYAESGPFFAALAFVGVGILGAGAVLIWPRRLRRSAESEDL